MFISNVIKDSFIDYKGEHSIVLFAKGCNLDCDVCYNKNRKEQFKDKTAINVLYNFLTPLHTAIVLSGGEPSTQDLYETCFDIKRLYPELKLKVFTNAQKPESVRACLDLVDFWSIDYKTVTKPDMNKVLGIDLPSYEFNVLDTIRLLDKNKKNYQVRIWKHPSHSLNDIDSMCNRVKNINTEINYELVDILK